MRVIQLLPTLSYGDAVGNDCLAIYNILFESGYDTCIYAEYINGIEAEYAKYYGQLSDLNEDDVLIYHLSTGTRINEWIKNQNCKKVMIYHNITPPEYFKKYNFSAYSICENGYQQVRDLSNTFDLVLADSEYNRQNLIDMGFKCDIKVLPIIIPFSDYKKTPNEALIRKYDDDFTNIIFVGRIAPNKKQEDIISAFDMYQKYFNIKSRLFLVGNPVGMETYNKALQCFVDRLGTKNVIFTGHTKFDEILAYYKISHLFLCMSEHEGFCVPLVESMFFGKPIVAYDSTAIGDTLNGGGVLVKKKNFLEIAGLINRVLKDKSLQETILKNQEEKLFSLQYEKIKAKFLDYLSSFIEKK